jgi:tRNA(Ile)-lysidine synthase
MLREFENKIADFIKAERLLENSQKLLLAVSGGADSIALLHVMAALNVEGIFRNDLICGHINHKLRGSESEADEAFVSAVCGKMGLEIVTRRVDVMGYARREKMSIETAGRKLRRESLIDIAREKDCSVIATGHHKNDNAETVLQRISRGTGFRGLGGIWPKRTFEGGFSFVRPLLCVTRAQVEEYLRQVGAEWRQDRTNVDCRYRRNFIRHRLLPELQSKCEGSLVEQLAELSESTRKLWGIICESADAMWSKAGKLGDRVEMDAEVFCGQNPVVGVELVRRGLVEAGCSERDLTAEHYERILRLAQEDGGGAADMPGGVEVRRQYERLIFTKKSGTPRGVSHCGKVSADEGMVKASLEIKVSGLTRFGGYLIEADILDAGRCDIEKFKAEKDKFSEWFDYDKLCLPLVVRRRRNGDRFVPLGSGAQKKVGKFMTAQKVRRELREKAVIIADGKNIVWVCPIRIAEGAKVTGETKKILQLQLSNTG